MVTIFQRMAIPSAGLGTPAAPAGLVYTCLVVAACHWIGSQRWHVRIRKWAPDLGLGLVYCSILLAALLLTPRSGQAFIYFQF
jgi:hypothetical protein